MNSTSVALRFPIAADNNDSEGLRVLFGPRHKFYSSMSPEPLDTEGHLAVQTMFVSAFSNSKHEILDIFESDSKVAVRGTWTGTHVAEFNGIPATYKTVHLPFICIMEIDNDEIVNQWLEMDSMTIMRQLGVIPAPETAQ